ncbi:arginase [Anaerovorax odorimutans]|uniref:arginase n=1 Tax=Anaerovorax odorimutans TaxID=109327 RepID=UPI00040B8750|nr:arginase [Anaerovorax odorimutans]
MKQKTNNIHIIGTQMDLGASKRGVNMGPSAIRYTDLGGKLTNMGFNVIDKGDIVPGDPQTEDPKRKNFKPIFDANKKLYEKVTDTLKTGAFPVIIGGDHSISAGSVTAISRYFKNIGVIWIDAHGDYNDESSSPSGNMHGMPLSAVCGQGPSDMVDFGGEHCFVDPKKVAIIGCRDIDKLEGKRLVETGVNIFTIHDVDKLGMAEIVKKAIEVTGTDTVGIHVSFDLDSITPEEAPGVGTLVYNGLTVRESFLAAEMLAESGKILSLDMVELNPILDNNNRTGELACELILSLLGKSIY